MRLQLRSLVAAVALLSAASPFAGAVDLLFVTLSDNTIVKYDTTGNVGAAIQATQATFVSSSLNNPQGLAFDSSGNLYASNSGDNTISKFDSAGLFKSSISSNLSSPQGLAFDSSGNLYAVNAGNDSISKFNSDGNFVTRWFTTATPRSIAFKPVAVPEPSTYALGAIAAGVMAAIARRRKARKA
jgi:DNA-binding beta-propeller fold protein YncE